MASSEDGWPALLHVITLKAKMTICNTSVKRRPKSRARQSLRIKETTGVVDVYDCADRQRRCPFDDEMKVKNFGVRISSNGKRSFSQAAFLRRPSNANMSNGFESHWLSWSSAARTAGLTAAVARMIGIEGPALATSAAAHCFGSIPGMK